MVPRVKLLPVMDVLAAVVEHLAVSSTVVVPKNFSVRKIICVIMALSRPEKGRS